MHGFGEEEVLSQVSAIPTQAIQLIQHRLFEDVGHPRHTAQAQQVERYVVSCQGTPKVNLKWDRGKVYVIHVTQY